MIFNNRVIMKNKIENVNYLWQSEALFDDLLEAFVVEEFLLEALSVVLFPYFSQSW